MSNKIKSHALATAVISLLARICIATSVDQKWTKDKVYEFIEYSTFNTYPNDFNIYDIGKLQNDVDAAYPYLFELLDEAFSSVSSSHGYYYIISSVFSTLSHTKNNHDLFASVISNKLENFQGSPDYLKDFKQDAARAFERMKQSRESTSVATTVTINEPAQGAVAPQDAATTNAAPVTPATEPLAPQESEPAAPGLSPKRNAWLWWLAAPAAGIVWLVMRRGRKK
jgi:hypothetical protein